MLTSDLAAQTIGTVWAEEDLECRAVNPCMAVT